jgi:hypothetical protein
MRKTVLMPRRGDGCSFYQTKANDCSICFGFVSLFLGSEWPERIKVSLNTENPKKKGWKKVSFRGEKTNDIEEIFNVHVSGKYFGGMHYRLRNYLKSLFNSSYLPPIWVKVEVDKPVN